MNYQESIHYLEKEIGFASCPGLERIINLMEKLGNPEKKLKVIHVAGTNGKGSATAMLSSILKEAGYRTASYTSPHLEKYNERFIINGKEITDEAFAKIITRTKQACQQLVAEGKEAPTLFEVVTGAAYLYFAEEKVDIAIIEVGLGGRFDATNIIENPILSIIMSISMDHTDFLGNTIEAIAMEKAGIIKKSCPVVLYSQEELVYNIVKNNADALNAPLYCLKDSEIKISAQSLRGTIFDVKSSFLNYEELFLPLLGLHQVQNCVTVLQACEVLKKNGLAFTKEDIRKGISNTVWAGRMEICKNNPLVILDGAHNVDGIRRLAQSVQTYFNRKNITLILGVLGDKEYEKMAELILPYANQVVLTEPHSQRKLDAEKLANIVLHKELPFYIEPELENAYQKALNITDEAGIILCCGSLYMIGALRPYILSV
ncbi:bifunctional folylpolyglutamate synthase/dihydrofolate synthase [Anaerotignum sp. MB30-C6]|uniref:bifunctional folylpolyglutamate synthase/dihydrofolate synthase n=1 Tax=Anaerotignum sp. MB30-C6 TaxID=3070814 RepID=UPI0027DB425C|nr:folylpolyglutamate synthase/dihydrofolate synthase family protein [Anaerotignum sp. MB30-C6]WMI82289.1 folylpolyglutamate synthase/dihydrofolate synthase family protein [Anaerotignum sp. MB30-C6]